MYQSSEYQETNFKTRLADLNATEEALAPSRVSVLGASMAGSPENPLIALFREYLKVKAEFDNTCHVIADATQRKAMHEKALLELSEKIERAVEDGKHDPTVPRDGRLLDPEVHPRY